VRVFFLPQSATAAAATFDLGPPLMRRFVNTSRKSGEPGAAGRADDLIDRLAGLPWTSTGGTGSISPLGIYGNDT